MTDTPFARLLARIGTAPLDAASVEPLYVQIAARLSDAITSGVLAPGAQLPTEAALMEAYGVSRITVRQAVQSLVRQGQLASRRGKGTFVARGSFQQDLASLQGFRAALQAQGIEPETELLSFLPKPSRPDSFALPGLDLPVRLRRRYLVDGEPFAVVEACLPAEAAAVGRTRAERLAVYDILQQFLGLRIGRADVAIQCTRARAAIATELGLPARSHVLVMHRTSYTVTGTACEHMRISIVPERYSFRMSVPGPMQLATAIRPTEAAMD
jgi:GntR family transcriptional regulator